MKLSVYKRFQSDPRSAKVRIFGIPTRILSSTGLVMRFSCVRDNCAGKCKIWRTMPAIRKLEINAKWIALFSLSMFWAVSKTLKQLLCAFIRVSGSLFTSMRISKHWYDYTLINYILRKFCLADNSFNVFSQVFCRILLVFYPFSWSTLNQTWINEKVRK